MVEDAPRPMRADVVGSAALTDDEAQKIKLHRSSPKRASVVPAIRRTELITVAANVLRLRPHAKPFYEEDGRYARMRFSCAGFVLEAYKKARIKLLDPNALPTVDIAVIRLCYPLQIRLMDNGRVSRDDLGLAGDGPWPCSFAGNSSMR